MKQLLSFLIALLFFVSCKSPEKKPLEKLQSPKETVEAYLAATNRFDFEAAEKLLIPNKNNQMQLETIKKMEKSLPDERKKEFINKEKDASYHEASITNSSAQIIVTLNNEIVMPVEFNLRKVKNKWLIESIGTFKKQPKSKSINYVFGFFTFVSLLNTF
ncbi:hypothetical protein [Flavobacterium foetidum]|uniref:hypothetical protein n=1 Tax=Flavobacterium foetidum TaxID=2026681 RepID=UPI001074E1DB|nr:hypothetical protein [Flavobacterium foetidum]KAF2517903.1 hypothetical protein E0W73_01455 [Flavobacterium foetidum]